jgi:hypothetical protein
MLLGVVASIYCFLKLRDDNDWMWLALFWGVVFVVASFPDFRAGRCPAGRYQVIPGYLLLFPLFRMMVAERSPWHRRVAWAMYVLGPLSLAMGLKIATHPNYWYRSYHPLFGYATAQPHYELLLPDPEQWTCVVKAVIWTMLFLAPLFLPDVVTFLRARGGKAPAG